MKPTAVILILGILIATSVGAQPYEFDQNQPVPTEIVLFDDPENEGVKLGSSAAVLQGNAVRLYLKGLIEYQPVDIFVVPVDTEESIEIELVKATWQDVVESCSATVESVCQFSIRTLGDVGVSISGSRGIEYALITVVGAEIRPPLDTPFYQVSKKDLNALETSSRGEADVSQASSDSNMMIYFLSALVIALVLIVVFLLGKRSRQAMVLALIAAFVLPDASLAQNPLPEAQDPRHVVKDPVPETETEEIVMGMDEEWKRFEVAKKEVARLHDVAKKIDELRKAKQAYDKFWSSYNGLGDCINSGAPWSGRERIPSFCEDQEGCDVCFLAAREQFNLARYYFGRLKTIHSCTIKMTDSAKAFGDSFSTATKSGIGWDVARANIEKSVEDLNKAYDKKYAELMGDLGNSMTDMAICEAKYGLEDWYDRFGFVYYEFMKDKYERN